MTAPDAVFDPAPAAPNRLPLLLGAGVAAILVLFVLSKLLAGGGDSPDPSSAVPAPASPTPPTAARTPPGPPTAETFEVFTTKNPFLPLRSAVNTATASTPSSSGGRAAASPAPSSGAGSTTTATAPATGAAGRTTGTAAGSSTGSSTEPRRGERVALLDVFVEKGRTVANVQVNDTVHEVGAGDVFAETFKVVSLSQGDECGRFLFGDDQFRLCKGEEVLK